MNIYELRTDDGRTYRMPGATPQDAARRVADLHQVTVVAHRPDRTPTIRVGYTPDPSWPST